MKYTISAMVGKGSVRHNSRQFIAANVDRTRTCENVEYCNDNIEEVYHSLFDEALKRYNKKQTRSDRMIKSYYDKIRTSKQEKTFHEIILQVGNESDAGSGPDQREIMKEILDKYYRGFAKRNPNLRVFSAHIHMDEATPHIHIDFVPFVSGSKRGLDTRVSLKKALEAQGFVGEGKNNTEWSRWVLSEKKALAEIMKEYGIEWEQKNTHEKHLTVLDYKVKQREEQINELDAEIGERRSEKNSLDKNIESSKKIDEYYSSKVKIYRESAIGEKKFEELMASDPKFKIPEPEAFMSAKAYMTKLIVPWATRVAKYVTALWNLYSRARAKITDLERAVTNLREENRFILEHYKNDLNYKESVKERLDDSREKLNSLQFEQRNYRLLKRVYGKEQIEQWVNRAEAIEKAAADKGIKEVEETMKRFWNQEEEK